MKANKLDLIVACVSLVVLLSVSFGIADSPAEVKRPALGVTARAVVDRVIDGDTVDVTLQQKVRVRLIDCWAPETRGEQKPRGLISKAKLEELLPVGSGVVVSIPTQAADEVSDVFTFGRVVGRVWPKNQSVSVNQSMVDGGFATLRKVKAD